MTIAQQKIKDYCKANKISMRDLSIKLGYSASYLSNILRGLIPSSRERQTINEFFGIVDRSKDIPDRIYDKYYFTTNAVREYKRYTGRSIHYTVMHRWRKGQPIRKKEDLKLLCKLLDIKNEWIDEI